MLQRTVCLLIGLILSTTSVVAAEQTERRLPIRVYRDKMKAGWIGQIAGVSWGAPPSSAGRTRSSRPTSCPVGSRT